MSEANVDEGQYLVETVQDWLADAQVEAQTGLVRNVALLGPESRNGYRYTNDAMQAAVALYEARPVFLNHPVGAGPTTRKVQDYVGKIVNPRFEGGRVRGDIQMVGPNRQWVTELAASNPSDIGMSHVVVARRRPDPDGVDVVESIEKVLSVDVVAFPATTHSFAESQATTDGAEHLEQKLEETEQRLRAAERRLALAQKLRQANLPAVLISERWLDHVAELDPSDQDVEIRERQRLGRLLEVELPASREKTLPQTGPGNGPARRLFVQAVKGN